MTKSKDSSQCKLLVHKKCHKAVNKPCAGEHQEPVVGGPMGAHPPAAVGDERNGDSKGSGTPLSDAATAGQEPPGLGDYQDQPPDVTERISFNFPAQKSGVSKSTICDIKKKEEQIRSYVVRTEKGPRRVIEKIDQSEFEGFEYVNPLLMSLEDCV
nr:unnamed protein product [Callosobruchus analis]